MNNSSAFSNRSNYICLTVALGGLLFGFDTAVISGAIGLIKTQFALDIVMEGWLVSSGLAGCILGVLVTGVLSNRIGRKRTILLSAMMFFLSGLGCGLAGSVDLLIVARILGGVGVGMASVISPMLIAEFAPAANRGRMISYYQLAITVGILVAYFSNALFLTSYWGPAGEAWRPMFVVMAVPSIVFLFMLFRVPESPRWLVSIGQQSMARAILATIRTPEEAAKELSDMENAARKDAGEKVSLFTPALRLRLLIGILLAVFQQFSGINAIIYYGPSIFQAAGIGGSNALVFQVVIGAVNLGFTIIAIRWSDKYGRKLLLVAGLTGIVLSLIFCGLLFYTGHTQGVLLLILMLLYIACFAFSLGPVTWIVINEIFPTRVRVQAVSICTMALWVAVWLVGQFFPWMLEKAGAAVTFWIFAGFSVINFFFCRSVVKETKGKTLEEIESIFIAPH